MNFSFSLNDTFPPTNCNGLPNRLNGSTIAYGDIIKVNCGISNYTYLLQSYINLIAYDRHFIGNIKQ